MQPPYNDYPTANVGELGKNVRVILESNHIIFMHIANPFREEDNLRKLLENTCLPKDPTRNQNGKNIDE